MPNAPGGDEPSAPRGNYSAQRDKRGVAPDPPGFDYDPPVYNAGTSPVLKKDDFYDYYPDKTAQSLRRIFEDIDKVVLRYS
jgi:hypothetical protein